MDKLTKYYNLAAIFRDKYEQDEWNETVRRQRIYIFVSVIYLISFFVLSKIFGEVIAIYGIFGFFIETIVFSIWIGPVKK